MAWSLLGEGFDLSGDAAVFVAIQADAQNPELRVNLSAIVVPAWVSFSLSVVVSVISLVVRASIFIVQLRRRRRDVSHIGDRISYLQRLEAKIQDGQRTIRMVRSAPATTHPRMQSRTQAYTFPTSACTDDDSGTNEPSHRVTQFTPKLNSCCPFLRTLDLV